MRLYVCEKKDQVLKIAEFFNLKFDRKENTAKGKIKGKEVVIVPLAGHIMRLLKPEEYIPELKTMNWQKAIENGHYPFIPRKFKKKIKSKKEGKQKIKQGNKIKVIYTDYPKYFQVLKKYAEQADEIIASPDPDTEGMALFKEVIDYVGAMNKVIGYIKLNKLERKAVIKAINNLIADDYYKIMADAGETRGEYDWLFGINLSVSATVFLTKNTMPLHVGAVKTPTLRMVVERDFENENFISETFYGIRFLVEKDGKSFYVNTNIKNKIKEDVEKIKDYLDKNVKELTVTEFKKEKKTKNPPLPFTLTELASTVQKKYRISIGKTMQIAQKLYENGFQTYPRSDCNYYSSEMFEETLEIINNLFAHNSEYAKFKNLINPKQKGKAFNDKEVDKKSHTALAPTIKYPSNIDEFSFKVYDTVVRRFLIQFAPPATYYSIKGKAKYRDIDGKEKEGVFSATSLINEGYMKIEKQFYTVAGENSSIPILNPGDKLKVIKTELTSSTTKPKPLFTESTLLDAMEKIHRFYDDPLIKKMLKDLGIGTQATRIGIILSLVEEGYLQRKKGKIISTEKGRAIIKYLPEKVSSPILRAKLEEDLKSILDRKLNRKEFIEKNKKIIFELFEEIKKTGKGVTMERKPTLKQIEFAKNIAKKLGAEYTKEMENSFSLTKEFIDKYADEAKKIKSLSPKQAEIIKKYAPEDIKEMLKNQNKNYEKLKEWLDSFFKTKKISDKQKNIILNDKNNFSEEIKNLAQKQSLTNEEYEKVKKALDGFFQNFKKGK